MKLTQTKVRYFRNILDSTEVEIEEDETCLVGKNESGKTAFLEALCWLKPARSEVQAETHEHFPMWVEKKHRDEAPSTELVKARFQLQEDDRKAVAEQFGNGVLDSDVFTVGRAYDGTYSVSVSIDPTPAVDAILADMGLEGEYAERAQKIDSIETLDEYISELQEGDDEAGQVAQQLKKARREMLGEAETLDAAVGDMLVERMPSFFYFAEYTTLPDTIPIQRLLEASEDELDPNEMTARSLIRLAGADEDYLTNPDYERRKRELEIVANKLTREVLKYWSQNPDLRTEIDITQQTKSAGRNGEKAVVHELKVRIWDDRHQLSLPFREKSSGFQWFFSFLAAFSEFERTDEEVIILLDEPALGLHARAQGDFLDFIEDRLASETQVIYTTHSPFMVQPDRLERVRLVEDRGQEEGSQVLQDVLSIDPDTLFPLQGALGYDMAQHLFIHPNNLVVEGTSDFTYLSVVSDYMKEEDRGHLDDDWSIVPVGGADLIPTFVALLGDHLDVTIVVDGRRDDHQRLGQLAEDGYLKDKRIIPVGEVVGSKAANIEDVFTPDDYLTIYNRAFGEDVEADDLTGSDSIVSQLERHLGIEDFDHGRPADELLRHRDELLPQLSDETLERFESLFEAVNETLDDE